VNCALPLAEGATVAHRSLLALSTDGKGVTTLGGRAGKVGKGGGEQANGRRGERERSERTNIL